MSYDFFDTLLNPLFGKNPTEDWSLLISSSKKESHNGIHTRKFHNQQFRGGVWNNLDLSELDFDYCRFSATQLISCNFYNARIKGNFDECKCEDTNFSLAKFQTRLSMSSVFLNCSFIGSIWEKGYSFKHCLFYNCDLTEIVIDNNDRFLGTIFKNCLMSDVVAGRLKTLDAVILD